MNIAARIVGVAYAVLTLVLSVTTLGCGNSAETPAVWVGQVPIGSTMVAHWEHALDLKGPVLGSSAPTRETGRVRAINFLISAHWLIGEAAKRGLAVPSNAVKRYVEGHLGLHVNSAELEKKLAASGRTVSDIEFEARAALSALKLREEISSVTPDVSRAEVVRYYTDHRDSFRRERRVVDLIEQLPSRSAALALAKRLGPGQRFAKRAMHETASRPTRYEEEHNINASLVRAIYAAPLNRFAKPVLYFGGWVILVVRRVERGPLALPEVEGKIAERLSVLHKKQTLGAFATRYEREWRAKTTCRAGFLVAKCSESSQYPQPEAVPLSEI